MKNKTTRILLASIAALVSVACVQETPTSVGDVLLPGGEVLSVEVVLPPSAFLVDDTSFSGYAKAAAAAFTLIANKIEGVVDANMLAQFSLLPSAISVRNAAGTIVADSAPRFIGGRLVLKVDTIAIHTRPAKLRLFRTAEPWDVSATWTQRIDTGNVHLPWQTAGGTRGAQIDTATWASGDSVVFNVDSATIRQWNDTTNKARGALIVSETPNTRLRVLTTVVHVNAKSSMRADTTVTLDIVPTMRTFVFNPTLPPNAPTLRAGGVPAWRGFMRFRSDLKTLKFPCNNGQGTCTVPLDSAHLTLAQLILKPARPPLGYSPEDTVFVEARNINTSTTVPIERSPTGARISLAEPLAPSLFTNPKPTDLIKFNVTGFIAKLVNNDTTAARLAPVLSLIQVPEAATFGFAAFDVAPSLRLVLTATTEKR